MNLTRIDYHSLSTQRIGTGRFGAKTTQLSRFKDVLERNGVFVPPHISFPYEFFVPALIRAGVLNDHGELQVRLARVQDSTDEEFEARDEVYSKLTLDDREVRLVREALEQLDGFAVAVRSDEQTAKGVGVFKTLFQPIKNGGRGAVDAIQAILFSQLEPWATALIEKIQAPFGIGIQVMPLIGEHIHAYGQTFFGPRLSLAGTTLKDRDEVRFSVGHGLGGGVGEHAFHSKIKPVGDLYIEYPFEHPASFFTQEGRKNYSFSLILSDGDSSTTSFLRDIELEPLLKRMLACAREAGTDLYFELQSVEYPNRWGVTQVAEHTWQEVPKPEGTEIYVSEFFGNVIGSIGSGTYVCSDVVYVGGRAYDIAGIIRDISRKQNVLVDIGTNVLTPSCLATYSQARGIVAATAGHRFSLASHVSGVFREAGIPVIGVVSSKQSIEQARKKLDFTTHPPKTVLRDIVLWADELNEQGGVFVQD